MNRLYDKKTTCCFTGHRYIPWSKREEVKKALQRAIKEHIQKGVVTFISGGALGFDTLAAQCVLAERAKNPNVALAVMCPCRDQSAKWRSSDKRVYEQILAVADDIYFLNDRYVTGCMHERNRLMVNQSGYCIAYFDGKPGGTAYTVGIAKECGLEVENVWRIIDN